MGNGNGVSRGDRNRNARLARLRALVPVSNAIVGIDLADAKQMVVVTDHDSRVLARKTYRCRAWDLGAALDWAGRPRESEGVRGCDGDVRADPVTAGAFSGSSQSSAGGIANRELGGTVLTVCAGSATCEPIFSSASLER
jgi:hypothetical protein